MKLLQYPNYFDDELDVRLIIVEKETGKINYPVVRCVGSYTDYIVVGLMMIHGDWETYIVYATDNLPKEEFTVTHSAQVVGTPGNKTTWVDDIKFIEKSITARAKDRLLNFKGEKK